MASHSKRNTKRATKRSGLTLLVFGATLQLQVPQPTKVQTMVRERRLRTVNPNPKSETAERKVQNPSGKSGEQKEEASNPKASTGESMVTANR